MPEVMPKKILVPVDLSEQSSAALTEAAEIARVCNAKLVVMYAEHFLPQLDSLAATATATADKPEADKRMMAEKLLRDQISLNVPGTVPVESRVVVGDPVDAILNTARETASDWIVMATHGRTGIKRMTLGSVTEEVLRHADRPLLAVHAT